MIHLFYTLHVGTAQNTLFIQGWVGFFQGGRLLYKGGMGECARNFEGVRENSYPREILKSRLSEIAFPAFTLTSGSQE